MAFNFTSMPITGQSINVNPYTAQTTENYSFLGGASESITRGMNGSISECMSNGRGGSMSSSYDPTTGQFNESRSENGFTESLSRGPNGETISTNGPNGWGSTENLNQYGQGTLTENTPFGSFSSPVGSYGNPMEFGPGMPGLSFDGCSDRYNGFMDNMLAMGGGFQMGGGLPMEDGMGMPAMDPGLSEEIPFAM